VTEQIAQTLESQNETQTESRTEAQLEPRTEQPTELQEEAETLAVPLADLRPALEALLMVATPPTTWPRRCRP
jgi:hypothetical protein